MATIHLTITSSSTEFPYEKAYSGATTLIDLKRKLELVVGVAIQDMKLELRKEDNKFVAELKEESKTLTELGVKDGSVIHVIDVSARSNGSGAHAGSAHGDVSERYRLDDEKYNQRSDSVRTWKQSLGVTEDTVPEYIRVGARCVVRIGDHPERKGNIAFVGKTHFKQGNWVGVVYDEPVGKNDGTVDGQRYFTCEPNHGGMVSPKSIFPDSGTSAEPDAMEEI